MGIILDQFLKGFKITEKIEEVVEVDLPVVPELMQTGEEKDQLNDSILDQKNFKSIFIYFK